MVGERSQTLTNIGGGLFDKEFERSLRDILGVGGSRQGETNASPMQGLSVIGSSCKAGRSVVVGFLLIRGPGSDVN
jgi:hypothetical protein